MASHHQERRKQLIVNKPMQRRLIANMALLPGIALAGIAIFTGIYVHGLMDPAIATDTELPNLMPLFYLVIVFELLAAVFLVANSLKISHLIAGPAHRICKSLEQMRSGDISFEVKLRRGDHLHEIGDELNLLLDWLNDNPPAGVITRRRAPEAATGQAGADVAASGSAAARLPIHGGAADRAASATTDPTVANPAESTSADN